MYHYVVAAVKHFLKSLFREKENRSTLIKLLGSIGLCQIRETPKFHSKGDDGTSSIVFANFLPGTKH